MRITSRIGSRTIRDSLATARRRCELRRSSSCAPTSATPRNTSCLRRPERVTSTRASTASPGWSRRGAAPALSGSPLPASPWPGAAALSPLANSRSLSPSRRRLSGWVGCVVGPPALGPSLAVVAGPVAVRGFGVPWPCLSPLSPPRLRGAEGLKHRRSRERAPRCVV